MKKLIFTFAVVLCVLLLSCNSSNSEITYSSKSCITLGNIEDWGAEIKSHEFNNGLGKITLKGKVTIVPESAFGDCTHVKSITLPNSITSIGFCAFRGCKNLKTIKLPSNLKTIEDDAFRGCRRLTSITIPNSVTSIGDRAFRYCESLASITIPDSVTSIGDEAFWHCTSLTSVYCKATTPPTGGYDVFSCYYYGSYGSKPIGCMIYVPRNSVNAYKTAEGWNEYADDIVGYDF